MASEIAIIEQSFGMLGGGSEEARAMVRTAVQNLSTGFSKTKQKMDDLEAWKRRYDSRSSFGRWWDNDVMAEKRDEMILVTMESAKQQMDVIRFIAWLNTQMLAMQATLNESQNQLKTQSFQLQKQQNVIQEQQQRLVDQQKRMEAENQRILEGCEVLRKLRSIVLGHEQTIGTNKVGIDELIVQLSEIYKDVGAFDKESRKRDEDVAGRFKEHRNSVDAAIRKISDKVEEDLRRTTAVASEVGEKFAGALTEIETALRDAKDDLEKQVTATAGVLQDRAKWVAESLTARVTETLAALQKDAADLRASCERRVLGFEDRVTGLSSRCEKAEAQVKRMAWLAVLASVASLASLAMAIVAYVK